MYDLIILGGGPAGLTAAVYAISKRLDVLLVAEELGGKTNYRMRVRGMEGFEHITGEEVVRRFRGQIEYLDHTFRTEKVVAVSASDAAAGDPWFEITTAGGEVIAARALIVATGATPARLDVPGEEAFLGRGVSYSAVSHAPLFWGRNAAVVGDGHAALRAAAELATVASQVYLVTPALPSGDPSLRVALGRAENVTELVGFSLTGVQGADYVSAMTVRGPRGEDQAIPVEGVFIELGLGPNSGLVSGLVDLNAAGFIKVDSRGATTRPGIFAAGDVVDSHPAQVLIAVGDGAKAALAAHEYLLGRLPKVPGQAAED